MIVNTTNKNTIIYYLWWCYVKIVYFFMNCYYLYMFSKQIPVPPQKYILNETESYIEEKKTKFLNSFLDSNNQKKLNSNIDPVFYSRTELNELMQHADNCIEPIWKRRILYETTPRGNIVMYYDSYKQGFAYYSDVNSIPYGLLNAVAMRYVLCYHCRDFFIDDNVTPENNPSPLIKIQFALEEQKKLQNGADSTPKTDLKDAPFAKFKNYNKEPTTEGAVIDKKIYTNNKFISLGKISNFTFLQSAISKNTSPINGFSSNLLNNLAGETKLQKQVMNYKDYKAQIESNR